jgi:flavodoxin
MNAIVIYDSVYGNTEKIARTIAVNLGSPVEVRLIHIKDVRLEDISGTNLLVIGSPTRGFRPTEAIQALLKDIPRGALRNVNVAVFDTRISERDVGGGLRFMMKLGGYAAGRIADALKKKGGNLLLPPAGFFVVDREGPLKEGETERASVWSRKLRDILHSL